MLLDRIRGKVLDLHGVKWVRIDDRNPRTVLVRGRDSYKITFPDGTSFRRKFRGHEDTHVYTFEDGFVGEPEPRGVDVESFGREVEVKYVKGVNLDY